MKKNDNETSRLVKQERPFLRFLRYTAVAVVSMCLLVLLICATTTNDDDCFFFFIFFAGREIHIIKELLLSRGTKRDQKHHH